MTEPTAPNDRAERAGVKFKDADLIGIPLQIVLGRGAKDGKAEFRNRWRAEKRDVALAGVAREAFRAHRELLEELDSAADEVKAPV